MRWSVLPVRIPLCAVKRDVTRCLQRGNECRVIKRISAVFLMLSGDNFIILHAPKLP